MPPPIVTGQSSGHRRVARQVNLQPVQNTPLDSDSADAQPAQSPAAPETHTPDARSHSSSDTLREALSTSSSSSASGEQLSTLDGFWSRTRAWVKIWTGSLKATVRDNNTGDGRQCSPHVREPRTSNTRPLPPEWIEENERQEELESQRRNSDATAHTGQRIHALREIDLLDPLLLEEGPTQPGDPSATRGTDRGDASPSAQKRTHGLGMVRPQGMPGSTTGFDVGVGLPVVESFAASMTIGSGVDEEYLSPNDHAAQREKYSWYSTADPEEEKRNNEKLRKDSSHPSGNRSGDADSRQNRTRGSKSSNPKPKSTGPNDAE